MDPIIGQIRLRGHAGPDPEPGVGVNRYAYSGNDPINNLDPGGQDYEGYYRVYNLLPYWGPNDGNAFTRSVYNTGAWTQNQFWSGMNFVADGLYGFGELTAPYAGIAENLAVTTPFPQDDFIAGAAGAFGRLSQRVLAQGKNSQVDDVSEMVDAPFVSGEFSISDWSGYPAGIPRPEGPLRLIEGAEYDAARKAANQANRHIRRSNDLIGKPVDVHEIKPVKFGGSPTDLDNKLIIDRDLHRQEVTPWWNEFQDYLEDY